MEDIVIVYFFQNWLLHERHNFKCFYQVFWINRNVYYLTELALSHLFALQFILGYGGKLRILLVASKF